MSYFDRIRACNAWTPGRYRPLVVHGAVMGLVRDDVAERLRRVSSVFRISESGVFLSESLSAPEERTRAVGEAMTALAAEGAAPQPRGEWLAVKTSQTAPEALRVDRGFASLLGVKTWGVHVNGLSQTPAGDETVWVGARALDKPTAPGKLDNMIAGCQPAGLSVMETLVKEAAEEASVPQSLARAARPVGALSYVMEDRHGLRPDTLLVYDLAVPDDFTPRNADGEVDHFECWTLEKALKTVAETDRFKLNVNLVLIDLGLRRAMIDDPALRPALTPPPPF